MLYMYLTYTFSERTKDKANSGSRRDSGLTCVELSINKTLDECQLLLNQ